MQDSIYTSNASWWEALVDGGLLLDLHKAAAVANKEVGDAFILFVAAQQSAQHYSSSL